MTVVSLVSLVKALNVPILFMDTVLRRLENSFIWTSVDHFLSKRPVEKYFFNILDDKSNWGFTFGLRLKSDAFKAYLTTKAFLERSNAAVILTVHCGGELELTAGQMGMHFASKGVVLQRTVAYAHQQNGKSKHYI